jgi:hypothetical protein
LSLKRVSEAKYQSFSFTTGPPAVSASELSNKLRFLVATSSATMPSSSMSWLSRMSYSPNPADSPR